MIHCYDVDLFSVLMQPEEINFSFFITYAILYIYSVERVIMM